MFGELGVITTRIGQIVTILGIAFCLFQCFAGYRFVRAFIGIVSFIVGFIAGFGLSVTHFSDESYAPAVIGLAAGVGLAFAGYKLYLAGVFILCGFFAASAVTYIPIPEGGFLGGIRIVLMIAAFILVGILGVKFSRHCIIIITAATGAMNAVNLMQMPLPALQENGVVSLVLIVLLALFGFIVQRATTK